MIRDGRQSKADKRVSGGKAKLYRCTGAGIAEDCICCERPEGRPKRKCKNTLGCPVFARGYQKVDGEWHVTSVKLEHVNCAGQSGAKQKRASRKAVKEEAAAFVNANHKITSPELVKTLKESCGVAMVDRTANRMKSDILQQGEDGIKDEFKALESYLATLGHDSPGTIVD
ncbi:unnamed protein product, partial [Scytosiphon promiscuus]